MWPVPAATQTFYPVRFLNSPRTHMNIDVYSLWLIQTWEKFCNCFTRTLYPYFHNHASLHTYIHTHIHTFIHTYSTSIVKRPTKCLYFTGHKSNLTFLIELGNKTCYTESSWCEGLKNERWGIIQHNTDTIFHITHIGPRRKMSTKKCFACWKKTVKVKDSRNRPGVARRVPGSLLSQISKTFGTWRWWGRQPHAPAAFTPRKYSWYSFSLGA